jgi:transketolase
MNRKLGEEPKARVKPSGNASIWSRMGIRAVYGKCLLKLREENDRIFAISADLGRSSGLGRFADEFPNSFLNVGIAEQTLISVASGIARSGRSVFASTFAPFATLRAGEFVRLEMGYMQMPVVLVGLGSGLSLGYLGNSHYGLEDIGVVRSVAGVKIFSPADASEMIVTLEQLSNNPIPSYVRLTGSAKSPFLFDSPEAIQRIEHSFFGSSGGPLVVSAGATSGHVRESIEELGYSMGLNSSFGFLHINQIKPIATDALRIVKAASKILVLEEHFAVGGLCSALTDELINSGGLLTKKIETVNLGSEFPKQGSYSQGLERYGLSTSAIRTKLKVFLNE